MHSSKLSLFVRRYRFCRYGLRQIVPKGIGGVCILIFRADFVLTITRFLLNFILTVVCEDRSASTLAPSWAVFNRPLTFARCVDDSATSFAVTSASLADGGFAVRRRSAA